MKTLLTLVFAFIGSLLFAQEPDSTATEKPKRVDEQIDQITEKWDKESKELENYEGLSRLCEDAKYRMEIFHLLNKVHHYDSVVKHILEKMYKKDPSNHEVKKSLKDVRKLEGKYSTKKFIHFMNEECHEVKNIESEAPDSFNGVGENSYSGQKYILETQLYKYVKHVTHRVDKIQKHVHHLSNHYKE